MIYISYITYNYCIRQLNCWAILLCTAQFICRALYNYSVYWVAFIYLEKWPELCLFYLASILIMLSTPQSPHKLEVVEQHYVCIKLMYYHAISVLF